MKSASLLTCVLVPLAVVAGQESNLFNQAPPAIDEALRARVNVFYQAHITGKFKDAFKVVADDSQDDFLGSEHQKYQTCEIARINYSDEFTKATVVTSCKFDYIYHGQHMPVAMPLTSTWKVVDGEWYWYHVAQIARQTPFGEMRQGTSAATVTQVSALPADPLVLARQILKQVSIDKSEVTLTENAPKAEVRVTSAMPGEVEVTVDKLPYPGLSAKVEPAKIQQGGVAVITFSYDPATTPKLAQLSATVRILPTNQLLPVTIQFAPASAK